MPSTTNCLQISGKYDLLETLSQEVDRRLVRARHKLIERYYRIALFPLPSNEQTMEAAMSRLRRLAEIRHPSVRPPIDWGRAQLDGCEMFFIAEEWHDGACLSDQLAQSAAMPLATAIELFTEITEAVAFVHELGEVHGHLVPSEICVVNGHGKAAQFYLRGFSPFTPSDSKLAREADLRGLGLLLYSLLTGFPPDDDATAAEMPLPSATPLVVIRLFNRLLSSPPAFANASAVRSALEGIVRRLPSIQTDSQESNVPLLPLPLILLFVAMIAIGCALFAMIILRPASGVAPQAVPRHVSLKALEDDFDRSNNGSAIVSATADDLRRSQKWQQAADEYTKEIIAAEARQTPQRMLVLSYERRADCYFHTRDVRKALDDWRRAVRIRVETADRSHDLVKDYFLIGFCLQRSKQTRDAHAAYLEALRLKKELVRVDRRYEVKFPTLQDINKGLEYLDAGKPV